MILEKIFGGEFFPEEIVAPKGERYKELVNEISDLVVKLENELTEKQYEMVDQMHTKVSEIGGIDAEEYFKYGFSAGIMLMIEINHFLEEQERNNT